MKIQTQFQWLGGLVLLVSLSSPVSAADPRPERPKPVLSNGPLSVSDPLSPAEALKKLHLPAGYKAEIVASEPLVLDPVAFDWDERGRLWIVEMADYPQGMDGNGKPGGRVRVLKIHGGCDWYLCEVKSGKWRPVKLIKGAETWRYSTDYEQCQTLTGSTTKGDSYTRGIFGNINWEARKLLREHSRIVCSGYGWKDEPFNAMLKYWSDYHDDARMLLLHDPANIHEFEGRNKPWLWPEDWKEVHGSEWLRWHPAWLSDTKREVLESRLFG